jgi:hypothetical protein
MAGDGRSRSINEVLFHYLPGGSKECYDQQAGYRCPGRGLNQTGPKHKAREVPLQ